MTVQRHFRLVGSLLLVLAAFLPVYAQEMPLNGFDATSIELFTIGKCRAWAQGQAWCR
jgi:hypothetical protein